MTDVIFAGLFVVALVFTGAATFFFGLPAGGAAAIVSAVAITLVAFTWSRFQTKAEGRE